jgi:hypothetical protein
VKKRHFSSTGLTDAEFKASKRQNLGSDMLYPEKDYSLAKHLILNYNVLGIEL